MYVRVKEKQRAFGKGEDIMSTGYRHLKGKKRENLGEQRFFNDKHKSSRQSGKCKGEPKVLETISLDQKYCVENESFEQ